MQPDILCISLVKVSPKRNGTESSVGYMIWRSQCQIKHWNACLKTTRHFKVAKVEHKTKWSSHTHEADPDCKLHGNGQNWIILSNGRAINLWVIRNNNTVYHTLISGYWCNPSEWFSLRCLKPGDSSSGWQMAGFWKDFELSAWFIRKKGVKDNSSFLMLNN